MVDLSKLSWEEKSLDHGDVSLTAVLIHRSEIRIAKENLDLMAQVKERLRLKTWHAFYGELHAPVMELVRHARIYCPDGRETELNRLTTALISLITLSPESLAGEPNG